MHRHSYKGAKFGRETDQRRALLKSLADSLILHGSIETSSTKAKAVAVYTEKLITKAKKGDLHNRRLIISSLMTLEAAHKLVDEISPKLSGRSSGYLRVVRTSTRRGDNTQLSKVSFVDDIKTKVDESKDSAKEVKSATKKSDAAVKDATVEKKSTSINAKQEIQPQKSSSAQTKRTGVRGNR